MKPGKKRPESCRGKLCEHYPNHGQSARGVPYTVVPITVTSFTSFFYSVKRDRMASRYNNIYLALNCFVVQVMHFLVGFISAIACTEKWWAEASHHCSLFEKTFFDKTIPLKIIYGCNPHMFCMYVHICDIG
jgi:hypothetical protein